MRLTLLIAGLIFSFWLRPKANAVDNNIVEPTRIQALNNYVNFVNECVHGMVIVHRLLENYNQELNKYVDLEGYQINNFGNSDLPKNIFEDPEDWFYAISPLEWFRIAEEGSKVLPAEHAKQLNALSKNFRNKINRINAIRFDLENYLESNDLTQEVHVKEVYAFLEEGVELYDSFYDDLTKIEVMLIKFSRSYETPPQEVLNIVEVFDKTWFASKNILRSVRNKKDELIPAQINTLERAIAKMANVDITKESYVTLNSRKPLQSWKQALKKLSQIAIDANELIETAEVPQEYKFYGKFYYYHNAVLVNQMNRYGSGFANEMNKIIKEAKIPMLYRMEEPHYYQVIYPKKLIKEDFISSSDNNIATIPTKLKNREIVKSTRTIKVDSLTFEITLYDHKIIDGDIVSINFNGDWILEKHSLEGKKTKIKVQLNREGKNYLLLHAENEGKRPPNTMAVSYLYKGKKQTIVLSSNLAESEMIEILYEHEIK